MTTVTTVTSTAAISPDTEASYKERRRLSIGLTGGIGSGKSTVADLFGALGAIVIDTDLIAHALTAPGGSAMQAIGAAFGAEFVTAEGALDRVRMRQHVFSDPAAKKTLEAILHPLIRQETERATTDAEASAKAGAYLLYVVPLLVESGSWRSRVDRIVVVDCPETVQVARVMQRNAMRKEDVLAIMAAQATREARLDAADDVILNEGDASLLPPQVGHLHAAYCRMVAARILPVNPSAHATVASVENDSPKKPPD